MVDSSEVFFVPQSAEPHPREFADSELGDEVDDETSVGEILGEEGQRALRQMMITDPDFRPTE